MTYSEKQLTPPPPPVDRRSMYYDLFNGGLLLALTIMLLPAWLHLGHDNPISIVSKMTSWLLPASLGFLLVLRCRAVDMSIWMHMGLGGLSAAWWIRHGLPVPAAFPAAMLACGAIACISALLTVKTKLPAWLATGLLGLLMWGGFQYLPIPETVTISDQAFDGWVQRFCNVFFQGGDGRNGTSTSELYAPMLTLRMLIVAGAWSVLMLFLLLVDMKVVQRQRMISKGKRLFAALVASGMLAGLSGALWLMESSQTPRPSRFVEELVVPSAALMAGGMFLRGRGRTMLAGICLPVAMLITQLWKELVWPTEVLGYDRQMFLLVAMLLEVQISFIWCFDGPENKRRWAQWACGLSTAGLLGLALTTRLQLQLNWTWVQHIFGIGVWAAGSLWMILQMVLAEKAGHKLPEDSMPPVA